jgi:hypothetical protein
MRASTAAVAIFLDVPTAPPTLAIVTIVVILGGGVALSVGPFELGTIRLAGVSLLWWYGVVAAPVVAVAVTIAALAHAARPSEPPAPASES